MVKKQDTIYALSTPPGKSAIAVVRISGKKAKEVIKKLTGDRTYSFRHDGVKFSSG